MNKGDVVQLKIIDMTEEGQGIGRLSFGNGETEQGLAVFVDGGVYGDMVEAEITKVKKRYALAEVRRIVESSEARRESPCPYIDDCGGCPYGMLSYGVQLELKEKHVRDKLERMAGLENPKVNPIIAMDNWDRDQEGYRNKAVMAVYSGGTDTLVGFRARKSHRVVDCESCRIQSPIAMTIAGAVRRHSGKLNWLKAVTVRVGFSSNDVMVILDVEDMRRLIRKNELGEEVLDYSLEDLIVEIDEEVTEPYSLESVALRDNKKTEVVAGRRTIEDEICGLRFEISPDSFYQVNPVQAEKLYEKALEYAGIGEVMDASKIQLLDLYCGVGTIGLIAASRLGEKGEVLGIESVKAAILDANRNAVINGIVNVLFIKGEAETVIPNKLENGEIQNIDTVILDPPRRGCDPALLDSVAEFAPSKIVYVSCDPATLARDVKILVENGYEFIECTPVDMFCDTGHVETVALLSWKGEECTR